MRKIDKIQIILSIFLIFLNVTNTILGIIENNLPTTLIYAFCSIAWIAIAYFEIKCYRKDNNNYDK